jgi:hypothetical protein
MCSKFKILAQYSPQKRIAICHHNSIHLFWKQLHYSFSFECLLSMITRKALKHEQHCNHIIVWVDYLAIKMSPNEYVQFTKLIASSEQNLWKFKTLPSPFASDNSLSNEEVNIVH